MKRIISCLIVVTLLLASVLAMIPASAAGTKFNVMGDSDANTQFKGEGNVFYYDYHKYIDDKGYSVGSGFEMSSSDKGADAYMLRLGMNAGSGTASVCDGVKNSGSFSHQFGSKGVDINGVHYNHAFGYSFKESVTVDAITMYLPSQTNITGIDVYGASLTGTGENKVYGAAAEKTLLASFTGVNTTATVDENGTRVIKLSSTLNEALKIDYLFLAIYIGAGTYCFYEIELTGVLAADAADFTALKNEYKRIAGAVAEDYTANSWTALETALASTDPVNKNCLSTASSIATAAATLKAAIDGLQLIPLDTSVIDAEIAKTTGLNENTYTPASWAVLANAIAEATAVKASSTRQSEVVKAAAAVTSAIAALTERADKSALEEEIAKTAILNKNDYTPATWSVLESALDMANSIVSDLDATDDDVTTAKNAITAAIAGLVAPGNKTDLNAKITEAKKLKKTDYNISGLIWSVFEQALETAEEISADENAVQTEIDVALADLIEAIEDLGEKKAPSADVPEQDDEEEEDTEEEEDEETEAPATKAPATQAPAATTPQAGGCGSSVALSALAIVGVIGTALVVKKKED